MPNPATHVSSEAGLSRLSYCVESLVESCVHNKAMKSTARILSVSGIGGAGKTASGIHAVHMIDRIARTQIDDNTRRLWQRIADMPRERVILNLNGLSMKNSVGVQEHRGDLHTLLPSLHGLFGASCASFREAAVGPRSWKYLTLENTLNEIARSARRAASPNPSGR